MRIIVNGTPREIPDGLTVAELLPHLGFPSTRVAVERNREVVRKTDREAVALAEGDVLEIVTFVGGG